MEMAMVLLFSARMVMMRTFKGDFQLTCARTWLVTMILLLASQVIDK
jgi:hypothetical protein